MVSKKTAFKIELIVREHMGREQTLGAGLSAGEVTVDNHQIARREEPSFDPGGASRWPGSDRRRMPRDQTFGLDPGVVIHILGDARERIGHNGSLATAGLDRLA